MPTSSPLSPLALRREASARLLAPRTAVRVFDDRLGLAREGLLLEVRVDSCERPTLQVLFKLPGRQDRVEYAGADFERFELSRAS